LQSAAESANYCLSRVQQEIAAVPIKTPSRRFDDESDSIAMELQRWPRNEYPLIGEATAESGVYELPALLRKQAA
jgi:hypothetical protein